MRVIDLTLTVAPQQLEKASFEGTQYMQTTVRPVVWDLPGYQAMIYHFEHWGMSGTYIDFPGHIKGIGDGTGADRYPIEKLYRVEATVIHMDCASGAGKISAGDLEQACPAAPRGGALVLNALGRRRCDEVAPRSVYLGKDAVRWIAGTGAHLFVSDVYESDTDPQDVFPDLFRAGISTVCCPINLDRLTVPRVRLTALPLRFPDVTQLPCRLVAEWE